MIIARLKWITKGVYMSKPIGGSGNIPFSRKPEIKEKQPKEGEDGHVKKVGNLAKHIKDDYIDAHTQPVDYHESGLLSPNYGQKIKLNEVIPHPEDDPEIPPMREGSPRANITS